MRVQRFGLIIASLSIIAIVGLTPAGAGAAQESKNAPIPINIGLPNSNYWPAYVARELKLFEKAGFKPTFYVFQSGAPLIAAMKSESLDLAWTGLATLFMVAQNIPLTYIYTPLDSSSQEGLVVNAATGIRSYRDIAKSKSIGVPTATCSHIALVLAAKKAGVPLESLTTSNFSPNLLQSGLEHGQIDSTFIWGPWSLQLRKAGYPIVSWDADYEPGGGVCATNVAVRPAFLAAHPLAGCKLVQVHAMTLEAVKKDPEIAVKSLEKTLGLSRELAKETYETLAIPSLESQLDPDGQWSLTAEKGGLAEKLFVAAEALREAKVFTKPLSLNDIKKTIDPKYVRQYIANPECRG